MRVRRRGVLVKQAAGSGGDDRAMRLMRRIGQRRGNDTCVGCSAIKHVAMSVRRLWRLRSPSIHRHSLKLMHVLDH
jgi:hypothetical protein